MRNKDYVYIDVKVTKQVSQNTYEMCYNINMIKPSYYL